MIINPVFRYQPKPVMPMPLNVRSCGHYYIAEKHWQDRFLKKNFLQLFWGIRGIARLRFGNREVLLKPEHVCFYLPGDRHEVTLAEAPLEYCWLTIDGDGLEHLINSFQITRELRKAGPCPVELFESLSIHLHDYSAQGEYLASADGYNILCRAFAGENVENSLTERFKSIAAEQLDNPDLHPSKIAKMLNVHPTTLNRNISAATGMTPVEYITALRMQLVLSLIRTSGKSFKEIALETGFANANYLAKVFRKKVGCSPSEFRNGTGLEG